MNTQRALKFLHGLNQASVFAWRYVTNRNSTSVIKRVGWISMIAISLSVLSLVFVLGVMRGLNQRTFERTLAAESHLSISLQISTQDDPSQSISALSDYLSTHPSVAAFFKQEKQDVLIRTLEGKFQPAVAIGLSKENLIAFFERIRTTNAKHGSNQTWMPKVPQDAELDNFFWFGYDLSMNLGIFEGETVLLILPEAFLAPAGSPVQVERVKVGQIYSSNLFETDANRIFYIPEESFTQIRPRSSKGNEPTRTRAVTSLAESFEVWLKDPTLVVKFQNELANQFPYFKMTHWRDRNSALLLALELERGMISFFLGLARLVAGLSVLSLIGIILAQKRRDLALMRVLGYSQGQLRSFVVGLGMIYTNGAILVGVLLGGALTLYFSKYPLILMPEIYYDADLPVIFDWQLCFWVVGIGLLGSLIGTLWVTRGLTRSEIAQTLKEKMA
jgi:lipoprotein-releasing system permease protein